MSIDKEEYQKTVNDMVKSIIDADVPSEAVSSVYSGVVRTKIYAPEGEDFILWRENGGDLGDSYIKINLQNGNRMGAVVTPTTLVELGFSEKQITEITNYFDALPFDRKVDLDRFREEADRLSEYIWANKRHRMASPWKRHFFRTKGDV